MRARSLLGLVALAAACRCTERPAPIRTADGAPPAELGAVADAYQGKPAKGTVTDVERAAAVLQAAGEPFGFGVKAAASLRAHGREPWAHRVAMFVDHGGTDQLEAAWLDLLEGATGATRVPAEVKLQLRQAQGRVNDDKALGRPEDELRARYLAELSWAMSLLDLAPDAGTP